MDPITMQLIIKLVVVPLIVELAERRGVEGIIKEDIEAFASDPEAILKMLDVMTDLRGDVVKDLANLVDDIFESGVDALVKLFKASPAGVGNFRTVVDKTYGG